MSDFARFWRLLVLVQQPLAVISPRGREGDNMLPVIFFVQSKQQIFSPGSLWLSLLLIRGVRHVGEGGGGGGSWESNYFSLFCPKRFFSLSLFHPCLVGWRERRWMSCRDVHKDTDSDVMSRYRRQRISLGVCFLAEMTGIHIWRSEFGISHFRP